MSSENPYTPVQLSAASITGNNLRLHMAASVAVLLLWASWFLIQRDHLSLRSENGATRVELHYPATSVGPVIHSKIFFIDLSGLILLVALSLMCANALVWFVSLIRFRYPCQEALRGWNEKQ